MRLKVSVIILLSLLVTGSQAKTKRSFKEKLIAFLDSSNVSGTDPRYIALPERPWRVVLGNNTEQLNLTMESHSEQPSANSLGFNSFDFSMTVKPPLGNSIGLWAGYRGWGLGYSVSLTGNKGINLSFNISTPTNGVNVSAHRFEFSNPSFALHNLKFGEVDLDDIESSGEALSEPMKIESLVLDAYWVFNNKRFSLAAPYGQSTLQLRSVGSLIAGLMFYYQKFDFSQNKNFVIAAFSNNVGSLKVYQGSLGVGYTYNWVPARNWTFNVVFMPVVSLLNKVKYSNYEIEFDEEKASDEDLFEGMVMTHIGDVSHHGKMRINLDTRAAISYWWKRFSFGVVGQGHRFITSFENTEVKLFDWEIKASLGYNF